MTYIHKKRIKGKDYNYESESYRDSDGKNHTRHVRYIGKLGVTNTTNLSVNKLGVTQQEFKNKFPYKYNSNDLQDKDDVVQDTKELINNAKDEKEIKNILDWSNTFKITDGSKRNIQYEANNKIKTFSENKEKYSIGNKVTIFNDEQGIIKEKLKDNLYLLDINGRPLIVREYEIKDKS